MYSCYFRSPCLSHGNCIVNYFFLIFGSINCCQYLFYHYSADHKLDLLDNVKECYKDIILMLKVGFNFQFCCNFGMSIIAFFTLYVRKFFNYLQAPVANRLNLNQIKVEYVVSFSDALFAFSITFMALSIQIPAFSSNISESDTKIGSITNTEYNSLHRKLKYRQRPT